MKDQKLIIADNAAFLSVIRAMYERKEISIEQYADSLRRAKESKLVAYKEHLCFMLGLYCMERGINYAKQDGNQAIR